MLWLAPDPEVVPMLDPEVLDEPEPMVEPEPDVMLPDPMDEPEPGAVALGLPAVPLVPAPLDPVLLPDGLAIVPLWPIVPEVPPDPDGEVALGDEDWDEPDVDEPDDDCA